MRKLKFTDEAWESYIFWQSQDRKTLKRINELIKDVQRSPFEGKGKPEALKAKEVLINSVFSVSWRRLLVAT